MQKFRFLTESGTGGVLNEPAAQEARSVGDVGRAAAIGRAERAHQLLGDRAGV